MNAPVLPGWAVVTPARAEHIARVEAQVQTWAAAMGVADTEAARWRRAALLHDALKDAEPAVLARFCPRGAWHPAVWHGPAAAAAAETLDGERDRGVLDAVRYHSVGYAGWDAAGRMLYLADHLEPGRTRHRPALTHLAARVPDDVAGVLRDVAAQRIGGTLTRGHRIGTETWEFWNSLATGDSASPD